METQEKQSRTGRGGGRDISPRRAAIFMVGESGAAELTAGRYFINVNVLIARLIATRFDRAPPPVSIHT